jgi:predicted Co/Zn/Cd cation transporter (cation efflux family)
MREGFELPPQTRGLTAISGAMALIAVLLMVQIWLLSAALESFLKGDMRASLPAAVCSGMILMACIGLYLFVNRLDREVRQQNPPSPADNQSL